MSDAPGEAERLDPSIWKVTAVAVLGSFLSQLDATIVNVSLSSLAVELHSTLTAIQWVTSGYLLALTLMLPLNGWLVDRIGARALYLWCFSAFTFSSALCGLAWSSNSLIGFRILQGMSGGLLAPMAQMMVARAAGKHMARVMGYVAVPILVAPILGPVIAGSILRYASWRWLFFVNLPVGALAFILAVLFLPGDHEETRPRDLDLAGLALLSPGLVLFLYGSDHLGERTGLVTLIVSVVLLAAFFRTAAKKGDRALIDLRLFRGKVFSAAVITQFMSNGIAFTGQMLIPIYLVRACGRSPSATGLLLAPLGLGMLCCYPFMGTLTNRFGIRKVSAGGAFLAFAGTLPFIYLAHYGLIPGVLISALFIRGAGMSAIGIPSMSAAYASVKRQDLPMATTTLNIVQRLGGPTLTTACATFLGWRLGSAHTDDALSGAFTAAFLLLCGLHAGLFAAAMRLPLAVKGKMEQRKQPEQELQQLVDFVPQLIVVLDSEGKKIHINRVFREYTGLTPEKLRSADAVAGLIHPDDLERMRAVRDRGIAAGEPFELDAKVRGKDGIYRWFLARYNPLVEEGRARRWYVTATEIESRKQEEERIRQENVRLEERTRIARELHDTLLQTVQSATLHLGAAVLRVAQDSPVKHQLDQILDIMRQGIAEGRNAIQGLRSSDSQTSDLVGALSRIQDELKGQPDIDFRVTVTGRQKQFGQEFQHEIYRIGREALANAFSHSGATRIELELAYSDSELSVRIRDNGCGIEPQVLDEGRDGHWGLAGIRERATRIGGMLKILSSPAAGTEVQLTIPTSICSELSIPHHSP